MYAQEGLQQTSDGFRSSTFSSPFCAKNHLEADIMPRPKGSIAWNKGLKGFRHSGSFKKGKLHYNYGKYGKDSSAWKGGRTIHTEGYILIFKRDHPLADNRGYVREHVLVMEKKLNRNLKKGEFVHHLDFNKQNNHPDNLHLFTSNSEHWEYHCLLRYFVREMIKNG